LYDDCTVKDLFAVKYHSQVDGMSASYMSVETASITSWNTTYLCDWWL